MKQSDDNGEELSMEDLLEDKSRSPKKKLLTLDDALPEVGDFGNYQIWLLVSLLPYSLGYGTLYFSQFFLTLIPKEHWCQIDELIKQNFTEAQRINYAIPKSDQYPYYDTCHQKDINFSKLTNIENSLNLLETNKTIECSKWEYNYSSIPYASIGAELDWVCENDYLVSTAQAIFFSGSIIGGFLFGWIADHKGRIPALTLCTGIGFIASCLTAGTNSFLTFSLCRFFTGLAFDNVINIPLIIVFEYMAVNRRSLVVNVAFGIYFAAGSTLLPWIAYYISNWRYLCFVTALPLASSLITPWILPESARWYVANKKNEEVITKLRRIASINKKNPSRKFYETFYNNLNSSQSRIETASLFDLFRTPRLAKNTILLTFYWVFIVLAFDGHIYSLKLLESSVFLSFSLACITELPAGLVLTLLLDIWGRRFCGFVTMGFTTIFSLAELLFKSEVAKLSMSISARFMLNMAANIVLQYAAEILPTPVRAQGVAMVHIMGICAHSLAPYIIDTAKYWIDLPMLIIVLVSLLSSITVLFLPESLGVEMPQTLEEGENFGKDQKFWSLPCLKKKNSRQN